MYVSLYVSNQYTDLGPKLTAKPKPYSETKPMENKAKRKHSKCTRIME